MPHDYYAVLGAEPDAKQTDIIEAFYRQSQKYHPLLNPTLKNRLRMHDIAEAWDVLGDPKRRKQYDEERAANMPGWRAALERIGKRVHTVERFVGAIGGGLTGNWKNLAMAGMAVTILALVYTPLFETSRTFSAGRIGVPATATLRASAAKANTETLPSETPSLPLANRVLISLPELTNDGAAPVTATSPAAPSNGSGAAGKPLALPTLAPAVFNPPTAAAPTLAPALVPPVVPPAPTVQVKHYAPPILIRPQKGTTYTCPHDLALEWTLSEPGTLGDGEWFLIESRQSDHPDWFAITDWTRDFSVVLHGSGDKSGCSAQWWRGPGMYEWRVRIIRGDRSNHVIQQFLSDPSAVSTIINKR